MCRCRAYDENHECLDAMCMYVCMYGVWDISGCLHVQTDSFHQRTSRNPGDPHPRKRTRTHLVYSNNINYLTTSLVVCMYVCMYVLALGGITCPYLTLSGAHVPRRITSTRGNDKICMMMTRLACNQAIESSYWRRDNDSDIGLLMGYVLYRLPVELEFMDLDTFPH
jgi:hypothetical protein